MEMTFWAEALVVLLCVAVGGRLGGVGLGATGGLGVCILSLGFGLKPADPPVSVLLIITAVIACTSILQGAGGLDLLVRWARRMLKVWPKAITFTGPLVCALFVMLAGTAYVAFSIYPVIAEVAASVKIRPERPLSASVICAGVGVMASPMSAAMAAMIGIMSVYDIPVWKIFAVTMPTYVITCLAVAAGVYWRGSELENDPEFLRRLQSGEYTWLVSDTEDHSAKIGRGAYVSVAIFTIGILVSVCLGSFPAVREMWSPAGAVAPVSTPMIIQMVMLATGFFIILFCRVPSYKFASGSVFRSGLIGVVGVFGIAWCTGTFFEHNNQIISEAFSEIVKQAPVAFCFAAFCVSSVIFSPTVTTMIMLPLGLHCGLAPEFLIGAWACCYGDFVIPGAAQIGCTAFDRTGTTRLGSFVINHSYLRPGLIYIVVGTTVGSLISKIVF